MHNVFATRWRKTKRRADLMPEDREAEPTVAPAQEAKAEMRDVLRGLAMLPEEQRQVVLLVAVEGFRYEEVADMLGVPIRTIMSRLSRARDRLGRFVQGRERPLLRRVK